MEEYIRENQGNPVEQLSICSQPGSRNCVNPHPALDKEKAQKMIVGSGLRCLRRFANLNHAGSYWKTCLVSCLLKQDWYSSSVALNWKLKGTKFNRCLFQLAASTPRTDGSGCGLLQSPMPSDVDGGRTIKGRRRQGETGIRAQIAMLPTPKSTISGPDNNRKNRHRSGGNDLFTQIAMLPTPTSRDHKSEKCSQETAERNSRPLSETLGTNTGMKLHSDFVCHLMGYPVDWLDV